MTLEHLLSGAAAVEDASNSSNASVSPRSDSLRSDSSSDSLSGDENALGVDNTTESNTRRRREPEPLPHAKFLKTEPGAVPSERELRPIQPMPKLPPISSLTQSSGLPPSLQAQQLRAQAARPAAASAPALAPGAGEGEGEGAGAGARATDEALCRYRNKLCLNGRAVKRNGELHNLCEKHRAKANQNQRKLESKRRVQKRQTRHATTAPPRTYQLTPMGAAVMPSDALQHQGHQSHQGHAPHLQGPGGASGGMNTLPSLAQLHRPPPPPPSSSSSYPYYDGHYPPPPYQR